MSFLHRESPKPDTVTNRLSIPIYVSVRDSEKIYSYECHMQNFGRQETTTTSLLHLLQVHTFCAPQL